MEKPYGCHRCDKRFARSDNLAAHVKIHEKSDAGTYDHNLVEEMMEGEDEGPGSEMIRMVEAMEDSAFGQTSHNQLSLPIPLPPLPPRVFPPYASIPSNNWFPNDEGTPDLSHSPASTPTPTIAPLAFHRAPSVSFLTKPTQVQPEYEPRHRSATPTLAGPRRTSFTHPHYPNPHPQLVRSVSEFGYDTNSAAGAFGAHLQMIESLGGGDGLGFQHHSVDHFNLVQPSPRSGPTFDEAAAEPAYTFASPEQTVSI